MDTSDTNINCVVNREHIQQKQSVRLVGPAESHIDKRALAEQDMERCVDPRYRAYFVLVDNWFNRLSMLLYLEYILGGPNFNDSITV